MAELTIEQKKALALADVQLQLDREAALASLSEGKVDSEAQAQYEEVPTSISNASSGLREEDVKAIESEWASGFKSMEGKPVDKVDRAWMNARQSFFTNTLAGADIKASERGRNIRNKIAQNEQIVARVKQSSMGATNNPNIIALEKKMSQENEQLQKQLYAAKVEGLKKQARRAGEYAGMPDYKGPVEGFFSLVGQLTGGSATPETIFPAAKGKTVLSTMLKEGASNAVVNAASNPFIQKGNIQSGDQEGYSGGQLASDVGIGMAFPWLMRAPGRLGQFLKSKGVNKTQADVAIEAAKLEKLKTGDSEIDNAALNVSKRPGAFRLGAARVLVPITDRLERIRPGLGSALNRHAYEQGNLMVLGHSKSEPFLKKFKKLPEGRQKELGRALMSSDSSKINKILKEHHLEDDYRAVRELLDQYYYEAKDLGIDISFRKEYWPRRIKDHVGLMDYIKGQTGEDWGPINRAISAEAKKMGLDDNEMMKPEVRAEIISRVLRGYGSDQIKLSPIGNLVKERKIEKITKDIEKYYDSAESSLTHYINNISRMIADKRFFGDATQSLDGVLDADLIGASRTERGIGSLVDRLDAEKPLEYWEQTQIQDIFSSYFNMKRMPRGLREAKELTQVLLLSNPKAAMTQFKDLAFGAYKNGIIDTGHALKNRRIRREDVGLESMGTEFADLSSFTKWSNRFFKWGGFEKADKLGKETFLNSTWRNIQKKANAPANSPTYKALQKDFRRALRSEEEVESAIKAFREDDISNAFAKFILFDRLAELQPITRGQLPESALKHPVGRIAYTLNTFALRQLNFVRKEIFDEIKNGNTKQGLKNLFGFASWYMIVSGSVDGAKAILFNEPLTMETLGQNAIDHVLQLFGANKWGVRKAQTRSGTALSERFTPAPLTVPFRLLDDIHKDARDMSKGDFEARYAATLRDFPVIGKLWDDWWGRSAKRREDN